jgi:hypothetical protein
LLEDLDVYEQVSLLIPIIIGLDLGRIERAVSPGASSSIFLLPIVFLLQLAQDLEELIIGKVRLACLTDLLHDVANREQWVIERRNSRQINALFVVVVVVIIALTYFKDFLTRSMIRSTWMY